VKVKGFFGEQSGRATPLLSGDARDTST